MLHTFKNTVSVYGIELYGQACLTQIKKVQMQQNKAIKILYNNDFRTPTIQL